MDPFSWAALIASVLTSVAATAIVGSVRATWSFLPIRSDHRLKSIAAKWEGVFTQASANGTERNTLALKLKARRKTVTGSGSYVSEGKTTNVEIKGGFVDKSQLILTYKNSDRATLQHGQIILTLSNDTNTLDGAFVGLGIITNKIVSGSVNLQKKA